MNKSNYVKVFGSGVNLAKAMGVSRQAVSQLPEQLPQKYIDWINGAAMRLHVDLTDERRRYYQAL